MAGCETCLLKRYIRINGESFCVEKDSYSGRQYEVISTMGGSTPKPETVNECDHPADYKAVRP